MKPKKSDVLKIAKSQIGYHEKASNASLDDFLANAGSRNYTKFAKELAEAGYYQASKQGFEWCAPFVDWCFWEASGHVKLDAETAQYQNGTLYGAGCTQSRSYYKSHNRLFKYAEVGDEAFFSSCQDSDPENADHTGIVVAVDGKNVTVIEGNKHDQVEKNKYVIGDGWLYDFGRPNYADEPKVKQAVVEKATEKLSRIMIAQRWLNDYNHGYLEIDGEWGPLTNTAAIKALQKCIGTNTDGIIGAMTRLRCGLCSRGDAGTKVKIVQACLAKWGYNDVELDGEFGPITEAAVRDFQKKKLLEVDGIVGKDTFTALLA